MRFRLSRRSCEGTRSGKKERTGTFCLLNGNITVSSSGAGGS